MRRPLHELYRDDVQIWHSFSNATMSKHANIARLARLWRQGVRFRYDSAEQLVVGNRAVVRHRVELTTPGGQRFVFHVALFASVEDGQITRIEEYFDAKELDALSSAVPGELEVGSAS
jgi:ketosteroid isomerase-like protein